MGWVAGLVILVCSVWFVFCGLFVFDALCIALVCAVIVEYV